MKILGTGGAGFIGGNFVHYMVNKYPEDMIVNLDLLTYAGNLETCKPVEGKPNYKFVKGDIADRKFIFDLFEKEKFDVVVNFAAESHVDRSIEDPEIFVKTNVMGTTTLLDACNEFGIKCIVVLGKADKEGDFSGDKYHAWNLVKIGDESYHVDVTWDNMYDTEIHHISYDYFNVTTKDILKDHQPIGGPLPLCDSTRLNYFYSTKSFVSTYSEIVELMYTRFNAKEIMFKANTDKGEFQRIDELKEKTVAAIMHVMFTRGKTKSFVLMFNELHNIAKVVFMPKEQKKIDLKEYG